jgi:lysophospholipase L1-like esterase
MTRPLLAALFVLLVFPGATPAKDPDWVAPMRKVHAKFTGKKGTFALFGDSITVSLAFWAGLPHARKNMSKDAEAAFKLVNGHMKEECWRKWRGSAYGNEGSMTIRWAHANVGTWLKKLNPETAIIMFGTNDLTAVPLDEYEKKLRQVVKKCLDNGTVVILSTIPPRHGMLDKAKKYAQAARRVARELKVSLCDYFAECLKRRPDDWDGAADKFKDYKGYDVPTLIARDGVHPSAPAKYSGDYSAKGLKSHGYGLRNYVTLMSYAEIIRKVLKAPRAKREARADEAKALRSLQKLGARFMRDDMLPGNPVVQVRYHSNIRVSNAGLAHIKGLAKLWEVSLEGTKVSDAGLVHLKGLGNLELLHLNKTKVSAAGVANLQKALPGCNIFH